MSDPEDYDEHVDADDVDDDLNDGDPDDDGLPGTTRMNADKSITFFLSDTITLNGKTISAICTRRPNGVEYSNFGEPFRVIGDELEVITKRMAKYLQLLGCEGDVLGGRRLTVAHIKRIDPAELSLMHQGMIPHFLPWAPPSNSKD